MLKINYISDIHIDSYINNMYWNKSNENMRKEIDNIIKKILPPQKDKAEILIIAGDISNYGHQIIVFLEEISKYYKKILFVFGNHDLYLTNTEEQLSYGYNSFNKLNHIKKHFKNTKIYVLDGNIININNIKIAGLSMWYDFSYGKNNFPGFNNKEGKKLWIKTMNDSKYIYGNNKNIIDPLIFFKEEKNKLKHILKEKPNIIISHIGPIAPNNMSEHFKNKISSFFYFDGQKILDKNENIKYWIFGHTHNKYHFTYNKTKLLCNPLGYKRENKNINKIKTITIK